MFGVKPELTLYLDKKVMKHEQVDLNNNPKTFEEAFDRLEQTIRCLEAGQISLDEATNLFETGMSLARRCNELLSAAELKVTRLRTAFAEQMEFISDEVAPVSDDEPE